MELIMQDIGNRIKAKRKELRLTQTDIYEKCGIASGALSQIENGTRTPTIAVFYKLSQALNCSMDWLATGFYEHSEKSIFYENEDILIEGFRNLPDTEKDEILDILEIKLRKTKRGKSFYSNNEKRA